tara:strand:- start:446 stop:1129 length:684 start_codon:yes stop_codon:yes gene_type:complete
MTDLKENVFSSGYHGGFNSKLPSQQLQKCSQHELDNEFTLDIKASLKSEKSVIDVETKQSVGPGSYVLDNMYGCGGDNCGLKKAREVQLSQPNVNFKGGVGWIGEQGCLVNNDSKLREETLTNKNYINQLPHQINMGFFGKGDHDVDAETVLQASSLTTIDRPCNALSGSSTLPYSLTPMLQKLEDEVQDTKHIIPEDSEQSWVRGGLPSRQIVRNMDYMRRCQEKK